MKSKLIAIFGFSISFFLLFHHEGWGINVLLLTILLLVSLLEAAFRQPDFKIDKTKRVALALFFLAGLAVFKTDSQYAYWIFVLATFTAISLFHFSVVRSFPVALLIGFQESFTSFLRWPVHKVNPKWGRGFYYLKLIGLPLVLLVVFLLLFGLGNVHFGQKLDSLGQWIELHFSFFFKNLKFMDFVLFLFGVWVAFYVFLPSIKRKLVVWEAQKPEILKRIRRTRPRLKPATLTPKLNYQDRVSMQPMGLKKEYIMGMMFLIGINAMLLAVNWIDIDKIWLNFSVEEQPDLSHMVHSGTWILIVSILLSMAIILKLFRRNLNFYPRNKSLKLLALLWMAQNFFLILSVALRNWHYISHTEAITFKRIGVFVFLSFTLCGLVLMVFKILKKWSGFRVFRLQSSIVGMSMVLLAFVNWSQVIVDYNLQHSDPTQIEYEYLFFHLNEYALDDIEKFLDDHPGYSANSIRGVGHQRYTKFRMEDLIERKSTKFFHAQSDHSWLSYSPIRQRLSENLSNAKSLSYED